MSGGGGGAAYGSSFQPPFSGQKRGFPFSGRGGSPDRYDGSNFAKLFVGSVPRTATEEEIRPLFEQHGNVIEVALIKDKRTGQQQGCCFIKYATSEEADEAIRALHNQYTLPGGVGPIQVRYADGERERLGAVEYKLFVGSLNKRATEKEVEEIFAPYGRVHDVYLMRDEQKQSRGCGFVKFSHKDSAMAAINALNGVYTMMGCDQPLTVRFADPKRPRPGESRGGPAFGVTGVGPLPASGIRSAPGSNFVDPLSSQGPPNAWQSMSPQNLGPYFNVDSQGFGNQMPHRSGVTGMPLNTGSNQSLPQALSMGQQIPPLQKPVQSPQHFPSSFTPASYSQPQTSQASGRHLSQLQVPLATGHTQQLPGITGQMPVPQLSVQQSSSTSTAQQPALNVNQQQNTAAVVANPHHMSAIPQQLPLQQSPSQLAQMLTQQAQSLQASFQSSQQAFSQLQQQFQMMQPASQNQQMPQNFQASKQQTVSMINAPAAGVTLATDMPSMMSSRPALHAMPPAMVPITCNWTEHTSPDGFKYYHNSATGESTWVKPEEFALYEQRQQNMVVQQPQSQTPQPLPSLQSFPSHQIPQTQQLQAQTQFRHPEQWQQSSMSYSYQTSGVMGNQNVQGLKHGQLLETAAEVKDLARFPQDLQAAQDWMWKNKPGGT
ncbi:hypothetical protein Nepgr_031566 [Nepenthes gracilis]|uniref:Flowering time control protein FCA n=1 Tax=Nepenthes gracilis TaxID=150966 RepID=A0AAD3TIQ8_NEPGR|nr:hypothetical protein Nepgr_031566 [Nepenthes gracilis]